MHRSAVGLLLNLLRHPTVNCPVLSSTANRFLAAATNCLQHNGSASLHSGVFERDSHTLLPALASISSPRSYATSPSPSAARLARAEERRKQLSKLQEKRPAVEAEAETEGTTKDLQVVEAEPTQASNVQIKDVVDHQALMVTRGVEWGQVILGFEQAQKYTVYDQDGNVVALMAEDETGIANAVGRQVLRGRRGFTATVFSADGSQIIFRVRRPAYLISSVMFIEDGQGQAIGEVAAKFHPLRRVYDLYLGKRQFASISEIMLAWQFELKDANGGTLAVIDRNFSGFAKELLTDAGKYVIHFGYSAAAAAQRATETVRERSGQAEAPAVQPVQLTGAAASSTAIIPIATGQQLVVARPLDLSERMIALACAISIDYDYFSRTGGGLGITPPLFIPFPGGGAPAGDAGGSAPSPPPPVGGPEAVPGASPSADAPPAGDSGWQQAPPESSGGDQGWKDDQEIKWDDGGGGGVADGDGDGGAIGGVVGTVMGVLGSIFGS